MEKIQRTFNKSTIALGLDVNAAISVVVALDTTTSELLFEGRVPHNEETWHKLLRRFTSTVPGRSCVFRPNRKKLIVSSSAPVPSW